MGLCWGWEGGDEEVGGYGERGGMCCGGWSDGWSLVSVEKRDEGEDGGVCDGVMVGEMGDDGVMFILLWVVCRALRVAGNREVDGGGVGEVRCGKGC